MPRIALIMGSDSDWKIMKECYDTLQAFTLDCEVMVASAHRTPERVQMFVKNAKTSGIEIIIAAAGAAAHLPGVVAAYTTLPVIGVPILGAALQGMDALLSIAQMPPGIPVATMAINGSKNAALYAITILALQDHQLANKLADFRLKQSHTVEEKHQSLVQQLNQE